MQSVNKSTRPATTIDALNDHVLREVFTYSDDQDLFALADVCTIFKRNAQEVFSSRNRRRLGPFPYLLQYGGSNNEKKKKRKMVRRTKKITYHVCQASCGILDSISSFYICRESSLS